nr:hypothetical protein [Acidobacteriota bacterium]
MAFALSALAAALFFLSIWIVVAAPSRFLLPLSVGAPEVSPLLLGASLLVALLSLRQRAGTRPIVALIL